MSLIKIEDIDARSAWGLWKIEESFSDLIHMTGTETEHKFQNIGKNNKKNQESVTGWVLIKYLSQHYGIEYQGIRKDEHNKPHLAKDHAHITITHSFPYVAAQLHLDKPVGIDLENFTDKILKLEHKYLNEQEIFDANHDLTKLMVYWSAKEALYKIHGRRKISFNEQLEINPFELQNSGILEGKIIYDHTIERIELFFKVADDYVMVYTL